VHSVSKKADSASHLESQAFVMKAQSPIETVEPGIKRQFLGFNEEIMAVRVWFDKGAIGQLHQHPHSQVS